MNQFYFLGVQLVFRSHPTIAGVSNKTFTQHDYIDTCIYTRIHKFTRCVDCTICKHFDVPNVLSHAFIHFTNTIFSHTPSFTRQFKPQPKPLFFYSTPPSRKSAVFLTLPAHEEGWNSSSVNRDDQRVKKTTTTERSTSWPLGMTRLSRNECSRPNELMW